VQQLADLWLWISSDVPSAPSWVLLLALLAGAASALPPSWWQRTRLIATWVHEAGHAVVALLTGRHVTGIRLEADTSGTTGHIGPAAGFGRLLTAFAGYPAPAVLGWAVLTLVAAGQLRWTLAGLTVLTAILLLLQRSWRGWIITILIGVALYALVYLQSVVASTILAAACGYLLLASPRTVIELHLTRRSRRHSLGQQAHSDADSLAALTGIPPTLWEIIFLGVCGWFIYLTAQTAWPW
jgi:hypothetical protein